jgi:hypothetical protein
VIADKKYIALRKLAQMFRSAYGEAVHNRQSGIRNHPNYGIDEFPYQPEIL